MAEHDGRGFITETSETFCTLSAKINGIQETLDFSRELFYAFGTRCDANLTNIVEEGMEVCFRCAFYELSNKPFIIAVWIGDKPGILSNTEVFAVIYNLTGFVTQIFDDDHLLVSSDTVPHSVLVSKDVLYPANDVAIGESVTLDASSLKEVHESGAMYEATCAWIGVEPRIVDRFSLEIQSKEYFELFQPSRISGTVVFIPNDTLAFVELDDVSDKIMLFRSSFHENCERLRDVVQIGDRLWMRIYYGYVFPERKQWFAAKAWKNGTDVDERGVDDKWSIKPEPLEIKTELKVEIKDEEMSESSTSRFDEETGVLYNDPPLRGIIRFGSKMRQTFLIYYETVCVHARLCDVYVNGGRADFWMLSDLIESMENVFVNFEAVSTSEIKEEEVVCAYDATCVWLGQKPRLNVVALSMPPPSRSLRDKDVFHYGTLERFYLPDTALIVLKPEIQTVCLQLSSLLGEPPTKPTLITDFVEFGECLKFQVLSDPLCPIFVRAVNVKVISRLELDEHVREKRLANYRRVDRLKRQRVGISERYYFV